MGVTSKKGGRVKRDHYRAAIIGLGRIASTIDDEVQGNSSVMLPFSHMGCFRAVPEVDVVAGADPHPTQRDDFARRWGVERVYADYREMLEREKPEIVSVATSAKPRAGIEIARAVFGAAEIRSKRIRFVFVSAFSFLKSRTCWA